MVGDGFMMEFLQSHTNVVYQPPVTSPYYSGINPYALGFAMMRDIRRICEDPTTKTAHWFPDIAGSDWRKTLDFAMRNFKDESFIAQYLSPKLIREFHFFAVLDDDHDDKLTISAIHDERGYRYVRQQLAEQYNLGNREPNIQVWSGQYPRRPRADAAPYAIPAPAAEPADRRSAEACRRGCGDSTCGSKRSIPRARFYRRTSAAPTVDIVDWLLATACKSCQFAGIFFRAQTAPVFSSPEQALLRLARCLQLANNLPMSAWRNFACAGWFST